MSRELTVWFNSPDAANPGTNIHIHIHIYIITYIHIYKLFS